MNLKNIDFKTERSEDCILIDCKNWVKNDSNKIEIHRMSGRAINTYLAEVLSCNPIKGIFKGILNEDDTVLLSRVVAETAPYRAFAIEGDDKRYYNAPILQVIGVFLEGKLSFDTLKVLFNRVLVKKVKPTYDTFIESPNDNTFVGEVVKLGLGTLNEEYELQPYRVSLRDKVLIRDNVCTEVTLEGTTYYAVEESMIVGIFKKQPYALSELEVISNSILMEEYMPNKVFSSSLILPTMNYDDLDYTELHDRNLFRVVLADPSLTKIKLNDILLIDRNITNYVYFNLEKYFIIGGMEQVEAKIGE